MSDAAHLLCLLQHADSAFPSGAVSFSGGLEALRNDGLLADETALHGVLREVMAGRFLPFDRVLVAAAWDAAPAVDALARLDDLCETATLPRELRESSRRAGAAMLSVHARLGTPGSHEFRARVTDGGAHAHLPVVQGLAWRGVGFSREQAIAAAAHALIATSLGAALRLGVVGHLGAQRLHGALATWLAPRLAEPPPPPGELASAAPLLDIAAMRHETQATRLFAS